MSFFSVPFNVKQYTIITIKMTSKIAKKNNTTMKIYLKSIDSSIYCTYGGEIGEGTLGGCGDTGGNDGDGGR